MLQGIDHIAVSVADIAASVDFYTRVLKMRPVDSRDAEATFFYWLNFGAGQTLNLCLNPDATPNAKGEHLDWDRTPHIAFVTSESFVETVESKLNESGTVYKRSGSSLYFTDPDGNFLELTFWREARIRAAGAKHW